MFARIFRLLGSCHVPWTRYWTEPSNDNSEGLEWAPGTYGAAGWVEGRWLRVAP